MNKKVEFVLIEMRKTALNSDLESLESKLKKEAKERTYLCKYVEDLTRKISDLPSILPASRAALVRTDPERWKAVG